MNAVQPRTSVASRHLRVSRMTQGRWRASAGGERNLVQAGEEEAVLDLRRRWQKVMRTSCCRAIEELTGRKVVGS